MNMKHLNNLGHGLVYAWDSWSYFVGRIPCKGADVALLGERAGKIPEFLKMGCMDTEGIQGSGTSMVWIWGEGRGGEGRGGEGRGGEGGREYEARVSTFVLTVTLT